MVTGEAANFPIASQQDLDAAADVINEIVYWENAPEDNDPGTEGFSGMSINPAAGVVDIWWNGTVPDVILKAADRALVNRAPRRRSRTTTGTRAKAAARTALSRHCAPQQRRRA
jgi:hypothetical protein